MVDINQIYASNSDRLAASDLQKPDGSFAVIQCVIEDSEVVDFAKEGDKPQPKVVLHLVDQEKTVVLNQTNGLNLAGRYGPDTDNWVGKPVIITASMKKFQGKTVPGIDVSAPLVPDNVQAQEYAQQAAPVSGDSFDDEPPF